jgi:hypothetical protein
MYLYSGDPDIIPTRCLLPHLTHPGTALGHQALRHHRHSIYSNKAVVADQNSQMCKLSRQLFGTVPVFDTGGRSLNPG